MDCIYMLCILNDAVGVMAYLLLNVASIADL